tara:strand:+ start:4911 stop:5855 length:945 start_codon:yes stop_codon:yes gene_type:complete
MNNLILIFVSLITFSCQKKVEQPDYPRAEFVETLPEIKEVIMPNDEESSLNLEEDFLQSTDDEVPIDLAPTVYFSKEAGLYSEPIEVDISCEKNGDYDCEEVSYTINGVDPDFNGEGIVVNKDEANILVGKVDGTFIIKAVGKSSSGKIGSVRTLNYHIDSTNPVNIITPVGGDYFSPQDLLIECDSCSKIVYTIDGTEPDFKDGNEGDFQKVYLRIGDEQGVTIIKYRSIDKAGNVSPVTTVKYNIKFRCSGNEISSTGFEPCKYTCNENKIFELKSNNNNTKCECKFTHAWDQKIFKCNLKKEVKHLITNGF